MGYVAVKGGTQGIEESIKRLEYERIKHREFLEVGQIWGGMRGLVDQVMSESSLYAEKMAALAIKQAEGNIEEAVCMLRAYRSTLPRNYYTETAESKDMILERRISASFKDIPGGQILGASHDYTHRLIDFDLLEEDKEAKLKWLEDYEKEEPMKEGGGNWQHIPRVVEYLRKEGLIKDYEKDDQEPSDITKKNIEFPAHRSERLQTLTRGQTGAVTALGYAALRAYGALHPTVGELRVGYLPLYIKDPLTSPNDEEDTYYIGEIKITEVETFIPKVIEKEADHNEIRFEIGYGICYGQNETKAIAMSILDQCLESGDPRYPTHDEEFVLLHIDAVESSGFIAHLKLPHYVTFQSKLDRLRKTKKGEGKQDESV